MFKDQKFENKCLGYLQLLLPKFKTKSNISLKVIYEDINNSNQYANLPEWSKQNFSITSLEKSPTQQNLYIILLEYNFWKEASREILIGILAHELTHLEFKMNVEPLKLFMQYNTALNYNCLEYIINYITIAKGFILETIDYRKYVLDKVGIEIGIPKSNQFIETFRNSVEFEKLASTINNYNFKSIESIYSNAYNTLIHKHI